MVSLKLIVSALVFIVFGGLSYAAEVVITHASGRVTKLAIDDSVDPVTSVSIGPPKEFKKSDNSTDVVDKRHIKKEDAEQHKKPYKLKWAPPIDSM